MTLAGVVAAAMLATLPTSPSYAADLVPAPDVTPSNPTSLTSSDHTVSTWSSDPTVAVSWSRALDTVGSIVAGYSSQWSTSPSTVPDGVKDLTATITSVVSPNLADGNSHYFHLRTVDLAGNLGQTVHLGPFWIDTTEPGASITSPLPVFGTSLSVPLAWAGSDAGSGVATYDVSSRVALFGPPTPFRSDTTTTSGAFAGAAGHTYCFSASATDRVGNVSTAGAEKCTSLPTQAASLARSATWKSKSSPKAYLGSYLQTKTRGSTLSASMTGKQIALVATTCPKCGKVVVRIGATVLKKVNLASPKMKRRQVITVATFPTARTGTLSISVTSNKKPVRIEGLGISLV